jgi:hypothetical protein
MMTKLTYLILLLLMSLLGMVMLDGRLLNSWIKVGQTCEEID